MSTTTVQMVQLHFEDNIYESKEMEAAIGDVTAGLQSITIEGKEKPTFYLRRAHFVDNNGVEHELITEEKLETARSLHLFFEEPDKP
ncbi:MAG TPA: hypothetical protein VEX68_23235 [Bryobacteraceae bacterium]|nr:hypothetical protein [Bryobacteraceae bacterium]